MVNWKEVAKFISGAAADRTLVAIALLSSGSLPMTFFGFTVTMTVGMVGLIIALTISVGLAYYAWFKK